MRQEVPELEVCEAIVVEDEGLEVYEAAYLRGEGS